MNLIVQGSKNFMVSDKMKKVIEDKVTKFDFFKEHIKEINFHLDKEKINFKVDVTMITHKLGTYQFSATDTVMYNAIDKVVHKIDVKIYREKGKLQKHSSEREAYIESLAEQTEEKPQPTIKIEMSVKPMDATEAYLNLKNDSSDFLGFIDVMSGAPSYLRKAGEDVFYLIKPDGENYGVYQLKIEGETASSGEKVREIKISDKTLLGAQNDIMAQDYHFDLFRTQENKIVFLFKGSNKWFAIV